MTYWRDGGGSRLPYGLPYYCEDNSEQERADAEEDARLDFESQWLTWTGEEEPK